MWPGVISAATAGDNKPYLCIWHWRIRGNPPSAEYDEIIRQSHEWDGTPEAYLDKRLGKPAQEEPGANG